MPKNAQTTAQLHLSHMLIMLKILQGRLQQYMNHEIPDVQAGFRKGGESEIKLPNPLDQKSNRVPEKHLFLFIDLAKAFDCVDHNKLENS